MDGTPRLYNTLVQVFSQHQNWVDRRHLKTLACMVVGLIATGKIHIPPDSVVAGVTVHRKPPEVRICRLRNQSAVGTRPPSTSTPHCPACMARR